MFKKPFQIIRVVIVIMSFVLLSVFIWVQYETSAYSDRFDHSVFNKWVDQIEKSPPLPTAFMGMYEQIHPITHTHSFIAGKFTDNTLKCCPCFQLAQSNYLHLTRTAKNQHSLNAYFLSLKLEKEVDQQQCLNYLLEQTDFLYNVIGIRKASKLYFNKNLENLSQTELAKLILIAKNPVIYNPIRDSARFKERWLKFKNQLALNP